MGRRTSDLYPRFTTESAGQAASEMQALFGTDQRRVVGNQLGQHGSGPPVDRFRIYPMVPGPRIELGTLRFSVACSTD